jgi:hypothetical protein
MQRWSERAFRPSVSHGGSVCRERPPSRRAEVAPLLQGPSVSVAEAAVSAVRMTSAWGRGQTPGPAVASLTSLVAGDGVRGQRGGNGCRRPGHRVAISTAAKTGRRQIARPDEQGWDGRRCSGHGGTVVVCTWRYGSTCGPSVDQEGGDSREIGSWQGKAKPQKSLFSRVVPSPPCWGKEGLGTRVPSAVGRELC